MVAVSLVDRKLGQSRICRFKMACGLGWHGSIPCAAILKSITKKFPDNRKEVSMARGVRKINREKFLEAYNMFLCGASLKESSKIVGASIPTLKKYFEIEFSGGKFPDNLWGKK